MICRLSKIYKNNKYRDTKPNVSVFTFNSSLFFKFMHNFELFYATLQLILIYW